MRKCLWKAYKELETIEVKKFNEDIDPVQDIIEDLEAEEEASKIVQDALQWAEWFPLTKKVKITSAHSKSGLMCLAT